jgi:hypothetical protein
MLSSILNTKKGGKYKTYFEYLVMIITERFMIENTLVQITK